MKKRVRVYKAGGQSDQPTQEQILSYISQKMSSDDFDGDTDSLKAELSQAGIPDDTADQYINYVSENLGLDEEGQGDEEAQLAAEEQARAQEEEQALYEQQLAEEEAAQKAQQEAMYNVEVNPEDTEDTEETADDDDESYMREGGTRLSKKSFIKQYTKFAKMAQGGDTPSPGADDVLNGREAHVKGFLGAVKNTANEAMLREEAENQYNSAYGAPQVGAFQDGGIHQEEVDFENPLHHLSAYGADTRHIFSDNMYTENDVAAMQQYGGNTGQGLYRFMGGGDNESADEMYQDADIDFNQEEYQMGGFKMPKRSGRQYTQAVGSPYYTATGKAADAVDLANRKVTSVDVTKRGIFGRPKAYTVNYDGTTSAAPAVNPAATPTGEYMPPNEFTGDRQPVADWMMRSGIPGIKQLGARMTRSGMAPNVPQVVQPTTPAATQASDIPYYPPLTGRAQRRDRRDDAQLNRFLGNNPNNTFNDPKEVERLRKQMPDYQPLGDANKAQAIANQASSLSNKQKEYGGDVSIPELYRAQVGMQTNAFDPNANALSFPGLDDNALMNESFAQPTETKKPLTPEEELLKYQRGYNQQLTYVDPKVAGESIAGIGTTDNPIKQKQGTSEDYLSKKNWDKTRKNFNTGMMAVNAGLDIFDQVTANRQQNQMLEDITSAESNYGISNEDNRGDYDPNSGLFRPDQMGFNGVARYGGVYANGGSTEDEDEDVQYMTQEEIDDFIANGGELEYL